MKSTLLAAAISGIVVGASGLAQAESSVQGRPNSGVLQLEEKGHDKGDKGKADKGGEKDKGDKGKGDKHSCKGKNDCKGKGGCKSDKHSCKGKNDCKSQGGCAG
jgi:hypothetical protein